MAMRRASRLTSHLCFLATTTLGALVGTASPLRALDGPPPAREFPAGVGEVYAALSESILKEAMTDFMKVFHVDFIYESTDGAALDRGPWRRLWLDRFADLEYEELSFGLEEALEEDDDRLVLRVRRVAVTRSAADLPPRLDETIFEDTWVRTEGSWQLELRNESEVLSRGFLSGSTSAAPSSPRVAQLSRKLGDGERAAVEEFWKEIQRSGAPLVEAIPDDPGHRLVTFLWRGGGRETSVRLRGGPSAREGSRPLTRLGESDVWHRSERLPADARFTYEFLLSRDVEVPARGKEKAKVLSVESSSVDPLNSGAVDDASLVELSGAPAVPWIEPVDGRARGTVERVTLTSELLEERRFVSVYTPPGYEELDSPCSAAFFLDRGTYRSRRETGTVLDNLLAEERIPPTVVFMIHSEGSRRPELEPTVELLHFIGEEVLGWARKNYRIRHEPGNCVLGGNGLGGLLAAATALEHSSSFGAVLAQNADFSVCLTGSDRPRCVPRSLALADRLPIRFFLSVGQLEDASVLSSNAHLRDVLDARGYAATFRSVNANQHAIDWHDTLARGLMVLLPRP